MSFERIQLRASTMPAAATTRAILWLSGVGDKPHLTNRGAERIQGHMSKLGEAGVGIKVTPGTIEPGYYVDSVHLTNARQQALKLIVDATETALLDTLEPAELNSARVGFFVEAAEPWNTWYALRESDMTELALTFAAERENQLWDKSIGQLLYT